MRKNLSKKTLGLGMFGIFLTACSVIPKADQTLKLVSSFPTAAIVARPLAVVPKPVVPSVGDKKLVFQGEDILNCQKKEIVYTPLPAIPVASYTDISIQTDPKDSSKQIMQIVHKPWKQDPKVDINALLHNISSNITEDIAEAGASIPYFGASKQKKYQILDFMKWRAEPIFDTNNQFLFWARVGVGMRVIIHFDKLEAKFDGLSSLAALASAKKASGRMNVELIGIDAKEVTQAIPFTTDLSESNVQRLIEALAIVKTKLYDLNQTTIQPNLIAKIQCADDIKKENS